MSSRDSRHPRWNDWYGYRRWRKRRAHQLRVEPWCRSCEARGLTVVATQVDHITRHNGDWNLFWLSPLQSLCKDCHDSTKRHVEHLGFDPKAVGDDGWPTDRRHPANTRALMHDRPRSAPIVRRRGASLEEF